jgi:hypothetical protein
MKRTINILLITTLFILSEAYLFSQEKMVSTEIITERLSEYVKALPFEDIYVHTDRDTYSAGESVWIKVYLFDRPTGLPSDKSSFAYVEILNHLNLPVARAKVLLVNGSGASLLELPDTLSNSRLTLRAYSNRMKNFLPEGCFMKSIDVINPFNNRFAGLNPEKNSHEEKPYRVYFYPEGGKMINGIPCRMGITVFNTFGNPQQCIGLIKTDKGEVVSGVNIDSTGIGSVEIDPESGRTYYFEAENDGALFTLPPVSESGSLIRVMKQTGDSLLISVASVPLPDNYLLLIIQSKGKILKSARVDLSGKGTLINIRPDILEPGINDIVLFDAMGNPLSERMIIIPEKSDNSFTISGGEVYGRREKVTLEIIPGGDIYLENDLTDLSLSVAVYPNGAKDPGAEGYLIAGAEYILPGPGKSIPEMFSRLSHEKKDILLLGTKSTWINWKEIMSGRLEYPEYQYEKDGQYITVSFFDRTGNPPPKDATALMGSPGKISEFQYSVIDSADRFRFYIMNNRQVKDLVFQIADSSNTYSLKIENQFFEDSRTPDFLPDTSRVVINDNMASLAVNYQVKKLYGNTERGDSIIPLLKSYPKPRFYGKPDQELIMDDYISLPTMREVFFELVRKISVRTNRKEEGYQLYDPVLKRYPSLFIDGIPIDDASKIINLNPAHVEQIDILTSDYRIGDLVFPGIINVITRRGDYGDIPLPKNSGRIEVKMFDGQWVFTSPDYSSSEKKQQRIPDFRNTLYWNSSIKPDESRRIGVEFWTSDYSSEYIIDLQGISPSGKVVSVRKAVTVE